MTEFKFKKSEKIKAAAWLDSYIDSLDDSEREYVIEVKAHKRKRSLNSNSYAWTLMDKLAEKTGIPKTTIYRTYIKEIGGNNELVCCKNDAVSALCSTWESKGLGWIADTETSKLKGCTNVRLYYGSSLYNTEQMSRLINMIVEDCRSLNIETLTPSEIVQMNNEWGD